MKHKLSIITSLVVFSFMVFQIVLPSTALGQAIDPNFIGPPSPAQQAAQSSGGDVHLTSLSSALNSLSALMMKLVPILIGLAVIAFLWGVMLFVFAAGNEDKRKDGKWMMVSGIIGIVVMVSVWGLVAFVQSTFGLNSGGAPTIGKMIPSN